MSYAVGEIFFLILFLGLYLFFILTVLKIFLRILKGCFPTLALLVGLSTLTFLLLYLFNRG